MTLEELIPGWRKWGKQQWSGDWICIRKSVLAKTNLPEETKHFLNQVGLPDMIAYSLIRRTLPPLMEFVSEIKPLPASFARYRVLMEVGGSMFLCFDEKENGQMVVVMADPEYESVVFFANSSIQHFAECCVAVDKIGDEEIEQSHAGYPSPEWVARYEQVLLNIDPPMLVDDTTWSARRIKNLKEGVW